MSSISTLRRTSQWEPPTLVDSILSSPLTMLATIVYKLLLSLRGRPFVPPAARQPIRIVCVSDTHDLTVEAVPDGDLLIHAGDMSSRGNIEDVQKQIDWLASLPHRHKIVVAGNHDECFLPGADWSALDLKGINYLENSSVMLEFDGGRKLTVFGSPYMDPWPKARVPMDTEVLVTHHPPQAHMDLDLGDSGLLAELWRVRPRLHVFGHVHWGHGREPVFFDDSQRAYETLMRRPRRGPIRDLFPHGGWLDGARLLLHGVHGVLWKFLMQGPGGGQGSLLVNAAQVYGNTGRIGRRPVVVEL